MSHQVLSTDWAEDDLVAIYNYLVHEASIETADDILDALELACMNLKQFPDRGHVPPELEQIGIFDFREIHCKKYFRIVYEVTGNRVFVHGVLDGRRDLQEILQHRLLRQA